MKRFLAILVAMTMVIGMIPVTVSAANSNGFQTNIEVNLSDKKWNTEEAGNGEDYDTLYVEYQLKGNGIMGPQGVWIAIDRTKLLWVNYKNDGKSIETHDNKPTAGSLSSKFSAAAFYLLKETIKDEDEEIVDGWSYSTTNYNLAAISEDEKTLYICLQPAQSVPVDYEELTTIVSLRFAILPGAELASDSVRYITTDERDSLNQSFIIAMNDGITNGYFYGNKNSGGDALTAVEFTGNAGITGVAEAPKVNAAAPEITTQPAGASYYTNAAAEALTVAATVSDSGTLTYEWFSNTSNTAEGGSSVATTQTFTPPTNVNGTTYYYAVVTNTNNNATGPQKTASVTSNVVSITVTADPDIVALNKAKEKVEAAEFANVTHEACADEAAAMAYVKGIAAETVAGSGITVTVEKVAYTAPVDGTENNPADPNGVGTAGTYEFKITLSKNGKSVDLAAQSITITATAYDGVTTSEAVAAAKTGLTAGAVDIEYIDRNDQAKKTAAVQKYVYDVLNTIADAVGVTADITHKADNTYTVTLTKGMAVDTKDLEMAINIGKDPDIAIVDAAYDKANSVDYTAIAQSAAANEDALKQHIKTQVDTAIDNAGITVQIETVAKTDATAGTVGDIDGTNGSYSFKIVLSKGDQTKTIEGKSIEITATPYDTKPDTDAVAAAKTVLGNNGAVTGIPFGSSDDDITNAVQKFVNDKLAASDDAKSVTAVVSATDTAGKYKVVLTRGAASEEITITMEITINPNPAIATVEAALNAVTGASYADLTQVQASTKENAAAIVLQTAKAAVNNSGVTVTVVEDTFTAAVAGNSADADGTNGSYRFKIQVSAGEGAAMVTDTMEEAVTLNITATMFDGVTDEEAIQTAQAKLDSISWADIAQADANTAEAVEAYIKSLAETAIGNDEVIVTVSVSDFKEATAGSAATTHEGIAGSFTFTVKVEKGAHNYTTSPVTKAVTATRYEKTLDSEAVAAAKTTLKSLVDANVTVAFGTTADKKQEKVEEYLNSLMKDTAEGVVVDIKSVEGNAYTVTLTKDSKTDDTVVIVTVTESADPDIKLIEDAKKAVEEAVYAAVKQANAADEAAAAAAAKAAVESLIDAEKITVDITTETFTAAIAGSAATTKEGTNGSYTFTATLTAKKGEPSETTMVLTMPITATPFSGVLDKDAVAKAEEVLVDSEVIIPINATEDEIDQAIHDYIESLLVGDAKDVTAEITDVNGDEYTITLTKGNETTRKTITITTKEADPIKLRVPASLEFDDGMAEWEAVSNAEAYLVRLYDKKMNYIGEIRTETNSADLNDMMEEDETYVFTVQAIGDGVYYLNSNESAASDSYELDNEPDFSMTMAMFLLMMSKEYDVMAEAGEGGSISNAGTTKVRFSDKITYTITPDEGYMIDTLIVDGTEIDAVAEYTFRKVREAHTISVTFKEIPWANPFVDVREEDAFYDAMVYVTENGWMDGLTEDTFAPNAGMTRAMLAELLGRHSGIEVGNGAAYENYAAWAQEVGLINGGNGEYDEEDALTVEQLLVIVSRYAQMFGEDTAVNTILVGYSDIAELSDWAIPAMKWAVHEGIWSGSLHMLRPQATATRADAAMVMLALTGVIAE